MLKKKLKMKKFRDQTGSPCVMVVNFEW